MKQPFHLAARGLLASFGVAFVCFGPSQTIAVEQHAFTPEQKAHWAFQAVKRPVPPALRDAWIRSPIDAFILSELDARKLAPARMAEKAALIRRASLDLTGLPPTPEEVNDFIADDSNKAFEKVIDRLLASPQYGERWGRHWLDLARYAESEGFKADETRPNAWRYRDYVIRSFNEDKPYNRFVQEQIAGDELWPGNSDAFVATAFNRHYPDESNARNLMQRRQEILNDVTDTVGAVFTGVTYACARCHDHKFDPILQKDYYRLQAFFANTAADDARVLAADDVVKRHQEQLAEWEQKTQHIQNEMAALEEPERQNVIQDYVEKYPDEIRAALLKKESERTPFECQMVAKANLYISPASHQYIAPSKVVAPRLKGDAAKRWKQLEAELKLFERLHPGELPVGTGMKDLENYAPRTYLLRRGVWDAPEEEVEPGFLSVLDARPVSIASVGLGKGSGRRSALARLLTDPANPLTARVLVNRVWHYHFGRGIVGTPSDFGMKGDAPTHPGLLDWLTTEFVDNGWSLKALHRTIMNSSTYQQAAVYNAAAAKADPENRLLWSFPRRRLEGETIRDAMLAVSGRLNLRMGGPSIFPDLPPGMESRGGWNVTADPAEKERRSIYVFVRRNTRYPMFETFDMPDTHESCSRRNVTTSPLQALTMLNSELTLNWARSFAGRILTLAGTDLEKVVYTAYQLAYCRSPRDEEVETVRTFFSKHREVIAERVAAGQPLALPENHPDGMSAADAATLVDFCHMLLNSNEFVYIN